MTTTAPKLRIEELELLCRDIFTVGVELGLPQSLLERLWQVHAGGSRRTSFNLDFMEQSAAPRPGRPSLDAPPRPPLQPVSHRRTVLIVDDDPLMIQLLTQILARENYELLVARDGGEALALAEGHHTDIDLLVADCEMPVMKGPELAGRLRATRPQLKVLYQTGFADMLFVARPVLDDDSAFLEKPFTARGLQEAARLALFGTLNPG